MLIAAGVLFVADLVLSFVSRATFQREEILTKWKQLTLLLPIGPPVLSHTARHEALLKPRKRPG